jgi:hypothetical protein
VVKKKKTMEKKKMLKPIGRYKKHWNLIKKGGNQREHPGSKKYFPTETLSQKFNFYFVDFSITKTIAKGGSHGNF